MNEETVKRDRKEIDQLSQDESRLPSSKAGGEDNMHAAEALLSQISLRILKECKWMGIWRNFHRVIGFIFVVLLIILPPILALGFVSSETINGKLILFLITIIGTLNALYQPLVHSSLRRIDMNRIRHLYDKLQAAKIESENDTYKLLSVYQKYSDQYAKIYEERGANLVESRVAKEQRKSKK